MKTAVVGATGMVGQTMIKVLEERNFPVTLLIPAASEKSVGKEIMFRGKAVKVVSVREAVDAKPDFAIFSAGATISKEWAPEFAKNGTVVIDNSSFWRMYKEVPLIVPEINSHVIKKGDRIIANPNCSTIQMVMALAPLHRKYRIKRLVVATYQSVTGTGVKAVAQMENERAGKKGDMVYAHPIDKNCFPHGGSFQPDGYTSEEQKLIDETRKILEDQTIMVTATVVRIPVVGGHSEAVNIEFEKEFDIDDVKKLINGFPGVVVYDNPSMNEYPMPLMAHNRDEVFVGRIRRDLSKEKCLNIWIVSDNIRKGAATNAVQIAEYMAANKLY
ncbi:MAG: aspartate-semialdehyde dehydrogenase [Bacteroidetes bacterium GWE2_41_25]|nr:MAG: aspartate-semialdehyde dehydrogenase [Bacteroidetes bacterium GWC2_40_22]OFX93315.1 MAG: aspartate-semialdehyde dehydrogenase [Bacteroidetes bacterium GWE2_41_25]OFY61879.1 MAG: aspartate-semialdehyde dehydrogenase [Bacteroidetes bacterium GWF2_41_9]HBH83806.1 aspartate-semialdehyde dehydrogenase [Bacteroidales bacterium]HBQ84173.1 aspartate-semialdehyde dehydrogenase [Bacteroidales bacterium]